MALLVTGGSGFVGSLLIPRLLDRGHAVRALGRDPERLHEALERYLDPDAEPELELVRGDALMGEGLDRALDGVDVAYYLIHSMERGEERTAAFSERDRIAAENFAAAASRAGVWRIVYLGGLVPRWQPPGLEREHNLDGERTAVRGRGRAGRVSRHLASREQVERILLDAVPDSVALRASIVIGARSRSFRLLVRLVERLPILTLPSWRRYTTKPIDQRDVLDMLLASACADVGGRSLEIGGPDALSYGDMLTRIAELMLLRRPSLGLGLSMTPIAARIAAAIVEEDPDLVVPLMEGLQGDLLPVDDHADELLGVHLHSFDAAVERALAEWEELEPLAAR
jgi:uncharacterized protein YbjT (DUF2867 family)